MDESKLKSLKSMLWPEGDKPDGPQVYCVLDGARDPEIAALVTGGELENECLFAGELHPRLKAAAPYLVHLLPGVPLTEQLLRKAWGNSWGIFALGEAGMPMDTLRLHFKKFLRVKTEDGKELMFRFYDPRVLRVYLPTCTAEELSAFQGALTHIMAETDDGLGMHRFATELKDILALDRPQS